MKHSPSPYALILLELFAALFSVTPSSGQQPKATVRLRTLAASATGRFASPRAFEFDVVSQGTKRVVSLTADEGLSAIENYFIAGDALVVVGSGPGGWRVCRLDLTTSRVIDTARSSSNPGVSPDARWIAYLSTPSRGVAALGGQALVILESASGKRRPVFPEANACSNEDQVPEADAHFVTLIENPILWNNESTAVVIVCRPSEDPSALELVRIDVSTGVDAPLIAGGLVQLPPASARQASDLSLMAAENLSWIRPDKLRISFRDGAGGPGFAIEFPAPTPGTTPCTAASLRPALNNGDIAGVSVRTTTAYRWFLGVGSDDTLQYVDGVEQVLLDTQSGLIATARYALAKDASEASRGCQFLPTFAGLHLRPWSLETDGSCPATSCWVSDDDAAYRVLVQRGPLMTIVNGYALSRWADTDVVPTHEERTRLVRDIAEALLARTGQ
jgi:hypothetical protein